MKYIGKAFDYRLADGRVRTAVCRKIEYNQLVKQFLFIGISPYGNTVRLSKDEVTFKKGVK